MSLDVRSCGVGSLVVLLTALAMSLGCRGGSQSPEKEAEPDVVAERVGLEDAIVRQVPEDFPEPRVRNSARQATLRASIEPTKAGVRSWLLKNRDALVTEVELRKVSLDLDASDEYLATIPFRAKQGEEYPWVLLIDGEKGGQSVVRAWTRRGVDTELSIVAHGRGGGPAVAVQMTYQGRSFVQLWRLISPGGNLVTMGVHGVDPGESAKFEAPNQVVVKRKDGTTARLKIRSVDFGFELVEVDASAAD